MHKKLVLLNIFLFALVAHAQLEDLRDGKTYKTVKIGSQVWMAQNLDYNAQTSKCYKNAEENCKKYGRLYNYTEASIVCPKGWHLPDKKEWETLVSYVESNNKCKRCDAIHLKSIEGWKNKGNGYDTYGFTALPGGDGGPFNSFGNIDYYGHWWSSTEIGDISAYARNIDCYYPRSIWRNTTKTALKSVRCIRN